MILLTSILNLKCKWKMDASQQVFQYFPSSRHSNHSNHSYHFLCMHHCHFDQFLALAQKNHHHSIFWNNHSLRQKVPNGVWTQPARSAQLVLTKNSLQPFCMSQSICNRIEKNDILEKGKRWIHTLRASQRSYSLKSKRIGNRKQIMRFLISQTIYGIANLKVKDCFRQMKQAK